MLKIISGGQTGVDRAALDAALAIGHPIGGWCPKGRRAEDGPIDSKYTLQETPSEDYAQRTEWNVRDSDATLIIVLQFASGPGTEFTIGMTRKHQKPLLIVDSKVTAVQVKEWISRNQFKTLNIAGPRENAQKQIYPLVFKFLKQVL